MNDRFWEISGLMLEELKQEFTGHDLNVAKMYVTLLLIEIAKNSYPAMDKRFIRALQITANGLDICRIEKEESK